MNLSIATYIILLSYKNFQDTVECIDSILDLEYENYNILIVENSESRSFFNQIDNYIKQKEISYRKLEQTDLVQYYQEKILLIKAKENRGFSAGNNLALNYLLRFTDKNNFVWILNNDTTLEKFTLTKLVDYFNKKSKQKKLGILGSKLIYYHDREKIQAIGGRFLESLYVPVHIGEGKNISTKVSSNELDYIVGASMFIKLKFVQDVGLMSEDYFLFYEELDWIYRAKQLGYTIDYCNEAIVYHKEGTSIGSSSSSKKSDFSEKHLFASRRKFVRKFYGLNLRYYVSTMLLLLNRFRKGKFKLSYELFKLAITNHEA